MEDQLRIREVAQSPSGHKNIDISSGGGLSVRGTTTPDMVHEVEQKKFTLITFIHDTAHNRAYFLQRPDIELAERVGEKWVKISKKWLDSAFAPAMDNGVDDEQAPPVEKPAKPEPATISNINDFELLPKTVQGKALETLVNSDSVPSEFKVKLLNDIITSEHPNLAGTVKQKSESILKEWAKG